MQRLTSLVGPLKCEVELPPEWSDFFKRRGTLPTAPCDKRRFPRGHLRASSALQLRQSLPALPRTAAWYRIYTKDVSRSGVGFFHSEQLFPGEQLGIVLPDGRYRRVEVARCRRVRARCFEIGATFVSAFR